MTAQLIKESSVLGDAADHEPKYAAIEALTVEAIERPGPIIKRMSAMSFDIRGWSLLKIHEDI